MQTVRLSLTSISLSGTQAHKHTPIASGRWLTGPYCRLCNVTDGSRYYDADESECLVCDANAAGEVATLVCVVLILLLVVTLFLWLRPDRKIKCLVRLSLRLTSLYTQISLRAKCARPRLKPIESLLFNAPAEPPITCLAGLSSA